MTAKRWSGRFGKATDPSVEAFSASVEVDRELWREDIDASIAHARMLGRQGIIPSADCESIIAGLEAVAKEIAEGCFKWRDSLEDVHGNIEARLAELIGVDVAGRLHTARSRNDQVATDLRLWLKRRIPELDSAFRGFQAALLDQADKHVESAATGFTHLQPGQPIVFAHHLLAYFEMAQRDRRRLATCLELVDALPLGSGAVAGVTFPIDRRSVADELGFARLTGNSVDAVSDRDFVIDLQAAAATAMVHLSRLAEEIVIWATSEFGLVRLDDAFATGSSIMPQKKNPDVAELVRGRAGRVFGNLSAILTTMKGLPLSYNRDLQEDKKGLFETVAILGQSLEAMTGLLSTSTFTPRPADSTTLATDYADYLVRKGLPFSEAHAIVGKLVALAEDRGVDLGKLSLDDLQGASPHFATDAAQIDMRGALEARSHEGGTAPERVREALAEARRRLEQL